MSTPTSIHHGLSVLSNADASQRLAHPLAATVRLYSRFGLPGQGFDGDRQVFNVFNDATTLLGYRHPAGHSGIDYLCTTGHEVLAMYGGIVTDASTDRDGNQYVAIQSWTKWNSMPAGRLGFEITYAHLESFSVAAGNVVKKGQVIGRTGRTGTWTPHLHVTFKAFNADGMVTSENVPDTFPPKKFPTLGDWVIAPLAERIQGGMNFACFLPADNDDVPAITHALLSQGTGELLSVRTSFPFFPEPVSLPGFVPVYTSKPRIYHPGFAGLPDWLPHSKIGCYVILGEDTISHYKFYRIQWKDNQQAWVPYQRRHVPFFRDIETVQVEEASTPPLPSQAVVHTEQSALYVSSSPFQYKLPNWGLPAPNSLGALTADQGYVITGTHVDRASAFPGITDAVAVQARRRWWQIDFHGKPGWVRSDWVNEAGPTGGMGRAWPPAPGDLQAEIRGHEVKVSWVPDAALADAPAHLRAAYYRVWRMEEDRFGELQATAAQEVRSPNANDPLRRIVWTDAVPTPRPDFFYYRVATVTGGTAGPATALVSASTAPTRPVASLVTPNPTPTQGAPDPAPTPDPNPVPPATAVPVMLESTQGALLATVTGPGHTVPVAGFTLRQDQARDAVGYFHARVGRARQEWLRLRQAAGGAGGVGGASGPAAAHVYGWVRMTALEGGRDWQRRARSLPRPPFVRVSGTGDVPVRVGPSTGYTKYLTHIDRDAGWQSVLGRNGAWWQIRADATRRGWVPAALVDETGDAQAVPFVNEAPPPALAGPGGTDAPSDTAVRASGHYLNLANSWQGSWTVSKSGTQVKAAFRSSRSPVQYLARQNPADLLVLPAGFRPKATKDIRVTGVHVTETGVDYDQSPKQNFTLRVSTTGAVRYVDSAELDHTGYLRYEIGTTQSGITVSWPTATAATTATRPALPDLSGTGTYHNRQVNRGSRWSMAREGDAVEGSFTTTRSPVEYFANQNREAQVWLPREYWPNRDARFQVKGAVRVNADGTNSTDTRKVNFWITVRSRDGRMYYDRDASLKTQGVGYLRYSVNVDWDASPRVQAPSAPRDLEVDSVTATEVELAWRSPADNGGDSVDEYKVERYRNGRWRTEEDDIPGTRHEVEDLSPHTRYGFRVAARNSAGWGPAGTAVSATTRRAQPGRARSLTATAAHDRVTLAWQAPSSGAAATGYRVERRVGSGTYAVVAADTGSAVTFHVDRTVQAATAYGYRVRALHHGEEGAWSSARTVTTAAAPTLPGSPTALRVAPGTASQLRLSWTAPGDTGGGVTGYRVERSPDRATRVWTVVAADTGSAETTWDEDGTLAADRAYHYRVRACNSAGASPASAEAAGRTRPRLRLDQPVRYPLTARAEPRADAAATATFARFLPERTFDLTGATGATDGWQRILSFHAARSEPLWVPMAAGSVQGASADLSRVPGTPAGFTATLAANHEVGLAWRAPASGAAVTGYRLWRQEDDGAWIRLGTDPAATATTHTDSTVTVGHAYRYRLQALSAEGAGVAGEAPALAVMATATAPETVRNLQATAAATSLQLSWQPAATGGLPAAYQVAWQASTATAAESVTVAGTGHALTDLRPGTVYTLKVTAGNQEGQAAAASLTVSTLDAAPGTPTEVSVAVAGNGAAATWQAPATGGYATGYEVQGKARTAAWPADTTARTMLSHALTNLTFDGDYDLRVRAVNTVGRSAWVAVPFMAGPERPGAVQDLAVAPGADSRLQLSWQAPADHSVVTGYRIERAVAADPLVWTEAAADTGSTDTVWNDSGLAAATTHHYRVTARSAAGLGTVSGEVEGLTRPQASLKATAAYPLKAHADPQTTAPVTHTWAAYDASVQLDVVARDAGGDWYRVLRFGARAHGPYWLPAGAVTVTGATAEVPEAPGLPTALAAAATHNRVTLTWTAPTTGGTVTGYRIWRRTGEDAFTLLATDPESTAATHTDRDREAATTYTYRVQALSAAGAGPRTAAVGVTTQPTPVAPGAPTGLTVAPGADSRLRLSWTAPTTTGTHALTGYLVEWSPDVDPRTWFALSEHVNTTDTTWSQNDLNADTVHHYRVRAVSAAGGGEPSAAAKARTRPQLALKADAAYPLQTRAWPAAEAPVTHTWAEHDDTVSLDIAGRVAGSDGWYRVLRFGAADHGPYWLPAAAVRVTGAATGVPEAPGLPATFKATATTHDSVILTWSAPATGGTVTGYRIWRQTGEEAFTVLGADLAADVLTHTDTTVMGGTAYRYRVQALSAAGAGARTAVVGVPAAGPPQAPGVPTALAAAPGDESRMVLTWTAPTDAGTQPISGYRIERAVAATTLVWAEAATDTGSTAVTWSDSSVAAATTYHYRVSARNKVGVGQPSTAAEGRTRPQATLSATAAYPLTAHRWPAATAPVSHTWTTRDATVLLDVAGRGAADGWFRVLRFGARARGPYWLPAGAVTVTGATTNVPRAPGVPAAFQGIATAATVTLTWQAPATGGTVTGYRLWRQAGAAAWTVLTDTLAADTRTHADTGLAANTAYRYRLQARSAAGHGPRTAVLVPAAAGPAPDAPVLTVYTQSGRVTLIVRGTDGTVQQALDWSGPFSGGTTLTGRSGYHRLVVPAGRTLTVRARSRDAAGRWSSWVVRTLATR